MKTIAYSYRRFSTPEQQRGHSEQRQIEMSEAYAKKNNLEIDRSLEADRGLSGYKGKNVTEGNLGQFLDKIENGEVPKGSYLLVENLDRLSRQRVYDAIGLFRRILDHQITIVTLSDEREYAADTMNDIDFIISIIMMSRAHEESALKSIRVKAVWNKKRNEIGEKKLTKWAPKWVSLSEDRTKFILNKHRANIVERIYKWSAAGIGTSLIIQKLESLGEAPWDMGEKGMTGRPAKKWYGSYIHKILHNRAVLGEHKLKLPDDPRGVEIVKGYYPQIVSEELFYSVQQARKARDVNKGGSGAGRKGRHLSNLFSGFAYCGYSVDTAGVAYRCAANFEKMVFINKGGKYRYLQCGHIRNGNTDCGGCGRMYRYDRFEKSFLSFINDIDVSMIAGFADELSSELNELRGQRDVLVGRKGDLSTEIVKYKKSFKGLEEIPPSMVKDLVLWEKEIKELAEQIDETSIQITDKEAEFDKTKISKDSMVSLIRDMSEKAGEELFMLRVQLAEAIKKVIHSVLVFPSGTQKALGSSDYSQITYEITEDGEFVEVEKPSSDTSDLMDRYIEEEVHERLNVEPDTNPFFIVIYKNGKQVIIEPDPSDPVKLKNMSSVDEHGLLTSASGT